MDRRVSSGIRLARAALARQPDYARRPQQLALLFVRHDYIVDGLPSAFLPVVVAVRVLPSAEITTLVVVAGLPSTLPIDSNVRLSMRL